MTLMIILVMCINLKFCANKYKIVKNRKISKMKNLIVLILIAAIWLSCFSSVSFAANREDDKWADADKAAHVSVSYVISVTAFNFYKKNTDYSDSRAKTAAFFTTVAIGAAKELIDENFRDEYFSWKDLGADALGAGLGVVFTVKF